MVVYTPPPLNNMITTPRFLVPHCKRERDHKKPIVSYTNILNQLSDSEWETYKLPPPSVVVPRPNVQLPDILDPVKPVSVGAVPVAGVHDVGNVHSVEVAAKMQLFSNLSTQTADQNDFMK